MDTIILAMILTGCALMVYNIIRYAMFVNSSIKLDRQLLKNGVLTVPLFLLIFFLVGYLIVGLGGLADLLTAAILLGGSIFVFLLLMVMYLIVGRVRDTEQQLAAQYEEMREEIGELTRDSVSFLRVNLTKDEVEERGGALYDSDYAHDRYSDLLEARGGNVLGGTAAGNRGLFSRDGLLAQYRSGVTGAEEVLLVRDRDGRTSFVKLEATMTKKPVSGDVVAFIVERPYNEEIVKKTLLEKVLMDQYDRIAYIINGQFSVLVSNPDRRHGLPLPESEGESYESVYLNCILPAMNYDRAANAGRPNPLRLSVIEKELRSRACYEVDAPFTVDGDPIYKRFVFYRIDETSGFYLMLLSDSTKLREDQERRNAELSEALAEAVRSNESRVRFFRNISHDLRTPLTGITGFADLAARESDPEKLRSHVSKIGASSRRLLAMMNDLFAMSLIDSGTLRLSAAPVELSSVADSLRTRFGLLLPEKKLVFRADLSGVEHTRFLCDAQRLDQVLGRLLDNSVSFAPEGSEVTFTAAETPLQSGGSEYVFDIANRGVKMPDGVVSSLFSADTWNYGMDLPDIPGSGLGMAVAKSLVDLMGGTVSVASNEDSRIVLEVRVPFEPVTTAESAGEGGGEMSSGGPYRLLVVDDNDMNREIAQLVLEGEGHKVDLAADGAEALRILGGGEVPYDAVLMDVQMPGMNGYETTAAIRALPGGVVSSVPVIAMTANAYQEDRASALAAGMNGYVTKPINPKEICDAVRGIIGR